MTLAEAKARLLAISSEPGPFSGKNGLIAAGAALVAGVVVGRLAISPRGRRILRTAFSKPDLVATVLPIVLGLIRQTRHSDTDAKP